MIETATPTEKTKVVPKKQHFKSQKKQQLITTILMYILLVAVSIVLLAPLLWMVFTSLKPMEEIVQYPPTFFPETIQWSNYNLT
ncbi:MAG: hypothetical protein L0K82_05375, partial [Pisciglobus halotolerans]|nr:hypothetical protein [Pisciglobus halotolerans]